MWFRIQSVRIKKTLRLQMHHKQLTILKREGITGNHAIQLHPPCLWVRKGKPRSKGTCPRCLASWDRARARVRVSWWPLCWPSRLTEVPLLCELMWTGSGAVEELCNGQLCKWMSILIKPALAMMPRNSGASRKQNEATKILTQKRVWLWGSLCSTVMTRSLLPFSGFSNAASETSFPVCGEWVCKRPK